MWNSVDERCMYKQALEDKTGSARRFGEELKSLLREGIELSKAPPEEQGWSEKVAELEVRLTWHLRNRVLKDDDNQRLLNGIAPSRDCQESLALLKE